MGNYEARAYSDELTEITLRTPDGYEPVDAAATEALLNGCSKALAKVTVLTARIAELEGTLREARDRVLSGDLLMEDDAVAELECIFDRALGEGASDE